MLPAESPAPDAPQPGANVPVEGAAPPPSEPENAPRTTASSQPDEGTPAAPAPEVAPVASPPPAPPKRDYAAERTQQRIDRLTAQKAALEAEVTKLKTAQPPDMQAMQAEIAAKATEIAKGEAEKIAAWNSFTSSLNSAIAEGQKEFGAEKFDKAVASLRTLHDNSDPAANDQYLGMLQTILDTGVASKLIAQLGEDPSEAARIMGLSPTKMGVELGKLAYRDVEDVSKAPKPLTPISGAGRNHVNVAAEDTERADGLDMRVWMERRNKHVGDVNTRAGRRVLM